ncbi:MAG: tRNA (adenosine(37)-N6)-threonylcarbamoyltransferase complex dimerization subunit type 1 TsaB [Paludibacteraceae bacterium]|nr:tRNA (adenosine(37)-N6)-threonylcarbamoyltransferase complex dimerization subunit type 1 TsaB [Paludibacteraceae bacterium]
MTILCIETSTSVCSAAICKDGEPMSQCICREGSNHARLLPRYIEELLSFAREQNLSIEAVALSEGPGSYTGLRIGTSTAKGLCYGLNIPLIPIPTLEVLKEASGVKEGILMPMIDARRMEVYTVINGETKAVVVENEDSLYEGSEDVYFFGDGAAKCAQVFTRPNWHHIPDIVPEAQFMGVLAEQITNHKSQITNAKSIDLAYYEPYYLKEFIAAQSHVKGLK